MTQQTQQTQQMQQPGGNYDARLGVLENDVAGIKSGISLIMQKLDARSSINWQPIGILLTALTLIGGTGFTWINMGQTRLEAMIGKQEARAERYVPREDLDTRFESLGKNITDRFQVGADRRNDLQVRTDDRIARAERDIETLQKSVVPRGEHEQMWAAQRARDVDLQRQSDQNRQGLYDLNTPRDAMQSMMRRLDNLEAASNKR